MLWTAYDMSDIIKVACQLLNISNAKHFDKGPFLAAIGPRLGLNSDVMNTEELLFAIQQPVWQFIQRILQLGLN